MIDAATTHRTMELLRLGAVRPGGWIRAQLLRDLDTGFAGVLDQLTERISTDLFRDRIEAWTPNTGRSAMHAATDSDESVPYDRDGESDVHWWDAETRGNWLWGTLLMAHLAGAPEATAAADARLVALRATQDPDGYLGIYTPETRFRRLDVENGELWAQSRALVALLAHHELTGDQASLRAAVAAADVTVTQLGPGRPHFHQPEPHHDLTGMTHGLNAADAFAWLTRLTGDARYLAFAAWLYEDFSSQRMPAQNDDMAAPNIADPTRPLSSHSAHTAEHLRPLLVARGDDRALVAGALRKVRLSSVPSGALIGDESVHGVPGPDTGYEICAMAEQLWSLVEALALTGEAWIGDWVERLLVNALQGSRTPDGRAISYLTADDRLSAPLERPDVYALIQDGIGRYKLSPTHEDIATCCSANSTRVLPHYVSGMWLRDGERTLVAALYGASEVDATIDGVAVRIIEQTAYPFEDRIRFTVTPERPVRFTLRLRRPGWASAVRVLGADATEADGWLAIDRLWAAGDTVELELEAPIVAVPYGTREVAVLRGPLQFVQPIAHETRVIKAYPLPGFADAELLPVDLDALGHYPVLRGDAPDLGFRVVRDPDADPDHPWDRAPIRLEGPVTLVPMGCTLLRRAAFALVD